MGYGKTEQIPLSRNMEGGLGRKKETESIGLFSCQIPLILLPVTV